MEHMQAVPMLHNATVGSDSSSSSPSIQPPRFEPGPSSIVLSRPAHSHQWYDNKHNLELNHLITVQNEYNIIQGTDTWILINIPNHRNKVTCSSFAFPEKVRLRFKSSLLRNSGFEAFGRLLDDEEYQMRVARTLRRQREIKPPGIKFLLDLGPSEDEERRMEHLEALSLPRGIIRWYLAATTPFEVPYAVCGGHDDACDCSKSWDVAHIGPEQPGEEQAPQYSLWDKPLTPKFRDIPDYCETRHAANVIRLLLAIDGRELVLNSAARVYTIAGLAKIFELGTSGAFQSTLGGRVCNWFLDPKNFEIMEVLPEETMKIAWHLKLPIITSTAFRVLVGEMVLCTPMNAPMNARPKRLKVSPFGRESRGILDEDTQSLLEHASDSLAGRISRDLQGLLSDQCFQLLQIQSLQRLERQLLYLDSIWGGEDPFGICRAAIELKAALMTVFHAFVRGVGEIFLDVTYQEGVDKNLRKYVQKHKRVLTFGALYINLSLAQKALTATFWRQMWRETYFPKNITKVYSRTVLVDNAWQTYKLAWAKGQDAALTCNGITGDGTELKPAAFDLNWTPFDLFQFWNQLEEEVRAFSLRRWDQDHFRHEPSWTLNMSEHTLTCLDQEELRLLPLWAEGLDDGTGGAFQSVIPDTEMGPNGPGPAYHTGYTVGSTSSSTDFGFDALTMADAATSVAGSNVVHDSNSTVSNSLVVVTPDESTDSDMVFVGDDEGHDSRFDLPLRPLTTPDEAVAQYVRDQAARNAAMAPGMWAAFRDEDFVLRVGPADVDMETESEGVDTDTTSTGTNTPTAKSVEDFSLV